MMAVDYTVCLSKLIGELHLEALYLPDSSENLKISSSEVDRPGLHLAGYLKNFNPSRIQIFGKLENSYLHDIPETLRQERLNGICSYHVPALILTRNIKPLPEMLSAAKKYKIPLLRSQEPTSAFMSALISLLNVELGPRITRHGVLVEVYGEGILIVGESGVGKSETAMELIKRGHRLIADDAVEIRRVSSRSLVGTAPANIRHFMELRGIGIVNARRLFGIGSVKLTEKINMVINMELWDAAKIYDRTGIESETTKILGITLPQYTIPVKPGRNLAVIIEVAAMNNRQKKMGYNAAEELLDSLGLQKKEEETENIKIWELF